MESHHIPSPFIQQPHDKGSQNLSHIFVNPILNHVLWFDGSFILGKGLFQYSYEGTISQQTWGLE